MHNTILFSLIIIFLYIFLFLNKSNFVYVETATGVKYLVNDDEHKQISAQLLSTIVECMFKLKNYLVTNINNKEHPRYEKYQKYVQYIKQLETNLNETKTLIYETDPTSDLTSYSVNKGEELSFCLKSKKTGKHHEINLLMYVALHEMAHIACPETGHGELFKELFKFLTEEAIHINIYLKDDYSAQPVEYCGMVLSSSIV